MGPSKIRRALGAVKDKTSIGLAKVGGSASLADLDVAIVKATRHDEYPAEERHIREILSLTCYSRAYISACVNTLSKRLNKTRNWTVALKTLMLIQRLLSEGDPAYEQEIFFSTRRGTRLLNMSDFRDSSQSNSWDYSSFVRTYALYLDERLEFRMQSRRGKRSVFGFEEDDDQEANNLQGGPRATPVREMRTEHVFSRMQHLQQLLERFLACRPTGAAKTHRVVIVALYPSVKESFQIYYDITEIMGIFIDRFMELQVHDCVKVYEVFCRVGKQFDELDMFYSWCKTIGIARSSEYPELEKITPKKLEVMDEFIRDKSALAQTIKHRSIEETILEEQKQNEEEEEDMNAVKALPPPPQGFTDIEEVKEDETKEKQKQQQEGDLLNLGNDIAITSEQHSDKLALALFDHDGGAPAASQTWEAFNDETADWETALVESASNLSGQKVTLAAGFDMLLLDGMFKQAGTRAGPGGSASSVAFGSARRPPMLALPAPPTSATSADPFAASLAVAPPAYVQMSEMEKKQKLLVEEQLMWQQYARDGMQGQLGMAKIQHHNPYNMGGYTHSY
ncbi:putative clathrin assembly protein At1g03050 [Alnus glutinosa]|uniref:putative clathrin assembly protein At1g03050 n=1 Tax=Alnus glutinosa TaxID=3517 RepID=UPI002D7686D9|nr:putative clathrin assembly protein At1g03050 [Alnus glutinosa]